MPIRLIKRQDIRNDKQKPDLRAPRNEALATTKAWLQEFKAKKSHDSEALLDLVKRI